MFHHRRRTFRAAPEEHVRLLRVGRPLYEYHPNTSITTSTVPALLKIEMVPFAEMAAIVRLPLRSPGTRWRSEATGRGELGKMVRTVARVGFTAVSLNDPRPWLSQ